jgi:hypothetical protein
MLALGLVSWMFSGRSTRPRTGCEEKFAKRPRSPRPTSRAAGRVELRRDHRGVRLHLRGQAGQAPPGPLPQHHRQPGAGATGWSPPACVGLPLFYGSYPITPASDILHELAKQKHFGVATFQAEDEIAAIGSVDRRGLRRLAGRHRLLGPGHRAEGRGDGPGADDRAAAARRRTSSAAARRPGCRPRPSSPTCCRCCTAATARRRSRSSRPVAGRLLRRGDRGRRIALTYRTPVVLLSDGYLANSAEPWRLPDVDDLPDLTTVRFTTEPNGPDGSSCPTCATRRRSPGRGRPGTAGARAPHRRAREGGRHRQHQLRPGNHHHMTELRHERSTHRRRPAAARGRRPDGRRGRAGRRLGLDRRADPGRLPRAARAGARSPGCTCATSPAAPDLGDLLRSYRRCDLPGEQHGQLAMLLRAKHLVDVRPTTGSPASRSPPSSPSSWIEVIEPHDGRGGAGVTTNESKLTKKDFTSDRRCAGARAAGTTRSWRPCRRCCPTLGARPESTVFVSGIGCSSRFPYYMDTYGFHSIHGRAPAIATGLAITRPDLDVWVVTGDGDGLSIGGNHLIHALRRNVNLKILLFNNEIYGLTKGQYSPTSPLGSVHKSTPMGSIDRPVNPVSAGARCRGDLRRPHHRHRPQAPDRGADGGLRAPGCLVRRDLPELQRLQRRRVRGAQGPGQKVTTRSGCGRASRSPSARRRARGRRRATTAR